MVDLHVDLLPRQAKCLGGGRFDIDKDTNTVYLYGSSSDFGSVTSEEFTEDLWIQSPRLQNMKFLFSNESAYDNITEWKTLDITESNF